MKKWYLQNNRENYERLVQSGWQPLEAILMANRGVESKEQALAYLEPDLSKLHDPFLFRDMEVAVDLIASFLEEGVPIRIVGDYDQDGVSATTILMRGISTFAETFGEHLVSYAIPDRIEDGYGINKSIVNHAIEEGVGLIITCDNGISAFDAISYARDCGLSVIVTDHHQIAMEDGEEVLPDAEAILNPHSATSGYPFSDLCGAGVAFKLVQALFERFDLDREPLFDLLQFAALGTICDVVPLVGENRIIAKEGLRRINDKPNAGIHALLKENAWDKEVTAYTVGYVIGPAINASGRLFTARLGVELFLEDDEETIQAYAKELFTLNQERKAMTVEGVQAGVAMVEQMPKLDDVLVLYVPSAHESICGLIAGRIKEQYYRPTIVLTDTTDQPNILKGSGRSIEAYHMYDNLNAHRDLFVSFGGHAMACGLSMEKDKLGELQRVLLSEFTLTPEDMIPSIELDAHLPISRVNYQTIETINRFEPFGAGNPKPKFADKNVVVRRAQILGKEQNVLKLELEKGNLRAVGIQFRAEETFAMLERIVPEDFAAWKIGKPTVTTIDICYQPDINEYNGKKSLQFVISDLRLSRS